MYGKKKKQEVVCNIHVFVNSTLIAVLCIVNLLFISAHWDHTKKPQIHAYVFTVDQNAETMNRYPVDGFSIPNLDIDKVSTFSVCCMSENVSVCNYSGYDASIQKDEENTFLVFYAKEFFNNTKCRLIWE